MKKLSKPNATYAQNAKAKTWSQMSRALTLLVNSLNCCENDRFSVTLYTDAQGAFGLFDREDGLNYTVTLWGQAGDIFAVPGFAADSTGAGWAGTSLNGVDFEVNEFTGKPVILAY